MKTLNYYFLLEFGWNKSKGWTSEKGFPRTKVRASDDFIAKHGYVDFEIFESAFVSDYRMRDLEYVEKKINEIKSVLDGEAETSFIFNESVELRFDRQLCRIIDNLGDSEGVEAPLSWNISTPENLQYIPSSEVYEIVCDWRDFLIEQEKQFAHVLK